MHPIRRETFLAQLRRWCKEIVFGDESFFKEVTPNTCTGVIDSIVLLPHFWNVRLSKKKNYIRLVASPSFVLYFFESLLLVKYSATAAEKEKYMFIIVIIFKGLKILMSLVVIWWDISDIWQCSRCSRYRKFHSRMYNRRLHGIVFAPPNYVFSVWFVALRKWLCNFEWIQREDEFTQ